jgi:hypothetical protein
VATIHGSPSEAARPLALVAAIMSAAIVAGCLGGGACRYSGDLLLRPSNGNFGPLFNVSWTNGSALARDFADATYTLVLTLRPLIADTRYAFFFNETPAGGTMSSSDWARMSALNVPAGSVGVPYALQLEFFANSTNPSVRDHVFFGNNNTATATITRDSATSVSIRTPGNLHGGAEWARITMAGNLSLAIDALGVCA